MQASPEVIRPAGDLGRRRIRLAAVAAAVIVVGLAARVGLPGAAGDLAGGVLYAALIYALVGLVAPRWPASRVGASALAISCAVELLQLTSLPADAAGVWPPARFVLGTSFVATDLAAYTLGVALAVAVDRR